MRIFFLLPFCAVFLSNPGFAQSACDTIVRNDGSITEVLILRYDNGGILYSKCGVNESRQYFLSGKDIKELKPAALPPVTAPPEPRPAYVETGHRSHLRNPAGPRHTATAWAGASLWNLPDDYFSEYVSANLKLGLEIGFKNNPSIRVAALVVPVSNRSLSGNRRKTEPGGEVGLTVKNFTVGRLSGYVSKVYWGVDVRFGQLSYTYSFKTPSVVEVSETFTWQRYMACLGYEFNGKRFAFDMSLPVGLSRYKARSTTSSPGFGRGSRSGGTLTIHPSISIGLGF